MTNKKRGIKIAAQLITVLMVVSIIVSACLLMGGTNQVAAAPIIQQITEAINTNRDKYLDDSVIYQLPDTVKDDEIISIIVKTDDYALMDAYEDADTDVSFAKYTYSKEADALRAQIAAQKKEILADLDASKLSYNVGSDYSNVISGFEILITAKDFAAVCQTIGDRATPIVGEVYNVAESQLVENEVDVHDTGIFDSTDFAYDGTGVVIAVLDTGLDYTHSAFSEKNFTADRSKLGLTFDEVAAAIGDTAAAELYSGLTASDVYVSDKVPYAFDYADEDPEVFPINSDHGTHVSGVIAGNDDTIRGVAPNAQLVEMKIFSDTETSARSSWILSALEDCVVMGVDVINMSIGTACGFSRETDKEQISGVYDKIREAGICVMVAASNSFNSTYGSEKNGNLGLTSNPDSATVGSPSTYEGVLSVASINGAPTSYLLYGEQIIYFLEATNRVAEERDFVEELLGDNKEVVDFEYVTIPGAGRPADYTGMDVKGKIALVRRGSTTFEEKANAAEAAGAIAVIIYNNVSGEIQMTVGEAKIPVCSIRQNDGELLAAQASGTLKIGISQASGPFMSNFSSWGPTPDLGIKPEITAHGGSILSAVPGQDYDRQSGTSMACPNMAGVAALLRQYVKENFPEIADDDKQVTALIYCLMMSTADIVINTNGLPYAVRKQGAGLANLTNSAATKAYIQTYDRYDGSVMDKTKIELGDDPEKSGVYTLKFSVVNFGDSALTYDLDYYVMTEGVSETKTHQGETTVTEEGYILDGAQVAITSISGGTQNGTQITVPADSTADLVVTITLSDSDKKYLDESFENGMYVEGFIILEAVSGTEIGLSVPYLAFYGDWTVAPMFDLDYYATNKDELDDAIDTLDKTLPDAYATRPIGGISGDYVSYLGSYYFMQDPTAVQIAADRKYISLTNSENGINSLRFIWAGLLRNAAVVDITITEDSTGEVVFERTEEDVRKSYGDGGSIYPTNIDVEFSAIENNLKNNTAYTVTVETYLDYGDGGVDTNKSNVFEFPLVTDFQAPAVTDCEFYTEYDKANEETRLFAKIAVYDNHYAMAMHVGYVTGGTDDSGNPAIEMVSFDQYLTPIYSEYNDTTYVVYELTDYIYTLKENAKSNPGYGLEANCFTVACYDYALNEATYQISLPDDFTDFCFGEEEITLSPNEVYTLSPDVYPTEEWAELLEYKVSGKTGIVNIVNNKIVAVKSGKTAITVTHPDGSVKTTLKVTVLAEGDEGYQYYDKQVVDNFYLSGYKTEKAYYYLSTEDRDLGLTGDERKFSSNYYSLSMFPSESVTLRYVLDAYFPDDTTVEFETSNDKLVTVDKNGTIVAQAEGFAAVTVKVLLDGGSTYYQETVNIEIKEPFITSGASLSHYFGLGGVVKFPETLAITEIGAFSFSNFEYIDKDPSEIYEDDDSTTKQWYIGENTITEVIIPDGVETIGAYAFANLTALKRIELPASLKKIDYGAFAGCVNLTTIEVREEDGTINPNGFEYVKFINKWAFQNCNVKGTLSFNNAVAIADYAFYGNTSIEKVVLGESTRSIGAFTFYGNKKLSALEIKADKIKLGQQAFMNCEELRSVSVNASVIPMGAFYGCKKLESVTLGKDVSVIGEYAFSATALTTFSIDPDNSTFKTANNGACILNKAGTELVLVAPKTSGAFELAGVTSVGVGAFAENMLITSVNLPDVTHIGNYAFSECTRLTSATFSPALKSIGDYAFYDTGLASTPSLETVEYLGEYAFSESSLTKVVIPDGMTVGNSAFRECVDLKEVIIGNNVKLGDNAFRRDRERGDNYTVLQRKLDDGTTLFYYVYRSNLESLTIGANTEIGDGAFFGAAGLKTVTLGDGAIIGDRAFYNACSLVDVVGLSKAVSIGAEAFSGDILYEFIDLNCTSPAVQADGNYLYRYYAPALNNVDISSATKLGDAAFAYCQSLERVVLGSNLKEIPYNAFYYCTKLKDINLSAVESIGEYALGETAITSVDLSSADHIGNYAFINNNSLVSVVLNPNGCEIGEGAFGYCKALANADLSKVTSVGDYAFAHTLITNIDLSNAEYIGEHAFIKEAVTKVNVTLSDKLEDMGDNPFAMCELDAFKSTVTETFNGKEYEIVVDTYDISDTIKVIKGSLYRTVPKGLELITFAGGETDVTVADDTVRISAMAFAGSDVTKVVFPSTLNAVGHKALYGCESLVTVVFASYNAPILEEEYDVLYYLTGENLPATGDYLFEGSEGTVNREGLGIVPFFMWNVTSNPNNVYYGANFSDYIGHIDSAIMMVRPVNGENYDSFIYGQYFNVSVDGAAAADSTTLEAMEAINRIPEKVTLADKATVEAARAAYDKVASKEQQALIEKSGLYEKLTAAEKRITDLEYLAGSSQGGDPGTSDPTTPPSAAEPVPGGSGLSKDTIIYIIIAVLFVIMVASDVVLATLFIKLKNGKGKNKNEENGEGSAESDENTDAVNAEDAEAAEEATNEVTDDESAKTENETADENEEAQSGSEDDGEEKEKKNGSEEA